jgi:hypothetical protein
VAQRFKMSPSLLAGNAITIAAIRAGEHLRGD